MWSSPNSLLKVNLLKKWNELSLGVIELTNVIMFFYQFYSFRVVNIQTESSPKNNSITKWLLVLYIQLSIHNIRWV